MRYIEPAAVFSRLLSLFTLLSRMYENASKITAFFLRLCHVEHTKAGGTPFQHPPPGLSLLAARFFVHADNRSLITLNQHSCVRETP